MHESSSDFTAPRVATQWPTCALAIVIYGGWGALVYFHADISWPCLMLGGGWFVAWQMSLQHEILHGSPTRWRALNTAIAFPPLTLWLPYVIYRREHLRHHRDEYLTDPLEDPESYYLPLSRYALMRPAARAVLRMTNTFAGRMTLGAVAGIFSFLRHEASRCLNGDRSEQRIWAAHLLGVAAVLVFVHDVCAMSIWVYILCFALPGRMLSSVRAFAEHRAHGAVRQRTAIVENAPLLGLLFLYNNLHVVHHQQPRLAWYRIPAYYRAHRAGMLRANGGLVYNGYADVVRRYLFTPHHEAPHPGDSGRGENAHRN